MGDTMREQFERFAQNHPYGSYDIGHDTRPGREGTYWSSHTQIMWLAFQVGHDAGRQLGMEQARREPLTDEQMTAIFRKAFGLIDSRPVGPQIDFIRAIEAAHGIPTQQAGDSDKEPT